MLLISVFAFFGGFLLNFMPCVLPVLSIKVASIIEHRELKQKQCREVFWATAAGIVFSMMILATLTFTLKSLGNYAGWGVQFQNVYFLSFLAIALTIFTANMLGLFHFNTNNGIFDAAKFVEESNMTLIVKNFLTGILTVLLATPCTAPFLGTSVSFAISQGSLIIFWVFFLIGLGIALPYIFLAINPKIIKILPKSGAWLIKLKYVLSFFLFVTTAWIMYIIHQKINFYYFVIVSVLITMIFLQFLVSKHLAFRILFATSLSVLVFYTISISQEKEREYTETITKVGINYVQFNAQKIQDSINENKVVFLKITADWCSTCTFNEARVFEDASVIETLAANNVVYMIGDISTRNEAVENFMEENEIYGIPTYIFFGKNAKNGIMGSPLIRKKEIKELINQAGGF